MNPALASTATARVLFALDEHEREAFFPEGVPAITDAETRFKPDGALTSGAWLALLEEFRPTVVVSCWSTPPIPASHADRDSGLRFVCHLAGSVRRLVPREFIERGGLVTNWGNIAGRIVAEHALLLALAALRNQPGWRPLIEGPRTKPWRSATMRLKPRSLYGRSVGIHGFGHVARALVALLRPFDVEIFAYSDGVPPSFMREHGVKPVASLPALAGSADVFFCCEALTERTAASINAAVLASLPEDAVFVNVGRGAVADEPALLREASSGRIRIALDVVAQEPLTAASPAANITDAVISPHIGGPTYDQLPVCGQLALDNLARFFRGEPLDALVTAELYDRST